MIPLPFHSTLNFGLFHVAPHTLLLPLAFVVLFYLISKHIRLETYRSHIILMVVLSLFGGRIAHVLIEGPCWCKWYQFFNPAYGGWQSFGALFGGIIGLLLGVYLAGSRGPRAESAGIRFVRMADLLAFYLPVWIIIYRIGCLLKGCCHGKETDVWWGVQYVGEEVVKHPTQIYMILNAAIIFGILWFFFRYKNTEETRFDGEIAYWFILLYCAGRFIIDFFRFYPEAHQVGGLVVSQWICVILFARAIYRIITLRRKIINGKRKGYK